MRESGWRVISHHAADVPVLLLQTRIDATGYTIQVTDLAYIWREILDKAAILERAKELGCSIDPSQDARQYKIFTDKLEAAFNQERDTSIQVKSRRTGTDITLGVTARLPSPLPAFDWEAQLQRKDGTVAPELTMPLVKYSRTLQQQVQDLVKELRAKDHVLSRLTDRLETSGTPLSEVFPNVANIAAGRSKAMSNAKLAQYIPGLRAFDEEHWLKHFAVPGGEDFHKGLTQVVEKLPVADDSTRPPSEGWWRGLDIEIAGLQPDQVHSPTAVDENVVELDDSTVFEAPELDGDKNDSYLGSDRTLSARDTTQHQTEKSMHSSGESDMKAPIKKLGAIGGRKAATEPRMSTPDACPDNASDTSHVSETQLQSPRTKKKLGTIGGKTSQAAALEKPTERRAPAATLAVTNQTKKLGVIGGRKSVATSTHSMPEPPERQHESGADGVAPTETSKRPQVADEEEAIDKRAALKRELEQKAHSPMKRKRKF